MQKRVLVTGAGGFIGHHLVKYLVNRGYWVRGVDIKLPDYEESVAHEFMRLDLRSADNCRKACSAINHVYHLAADMGGIGYISGSHATVARNNSLININMLDSALACGIDRFFFSSTACVYNQDLQKQPDIKSLKESDAHPAAPEEGYGWEKLYMEKLCEYYLEEHNLETRVARFHNVFGPLGTWNGGKEKVPAAVCRKVAMSQDGGTIEVWGDGEQTRSFTYVGDCVEGIYRIMHSDHKKPLNLGSEEMVSINQLVDIVSNVAAKAVQKKHDLSKPQGVRGRNSDNTKIREVLDWSPSTSLSAGIALTYPWIAEQVARSCEVTNGHSVPSLFTNGRPKLAVIGLGKLGSPMAATFAASGYDVVGVDVDMAKVDALNQGKAPVTETRLVEMLDKSVGRLHATTDTVAAVAEADLIFIIVPTPSDSDGGFSLKYVLPVCEDIGRGISKNGRRPVITMTSTVMPGCTGGQIKETLERASGGRCGVDFGLCYSPEFIALGSVIDDFLNPDFYLIGESDRASGEALEKFYSTICNNGAPAARMNWIEAEITKIAVNSFITMKITYANTLARICEQIIGTDVDNISGAIGLDERIGSKYLRGAIGYGGPCFPRDNRAFAKMAQLVGLNAQLALTTDAINKSQVEYFKGLVTSRVPTGSKVAILGVSYKPDTDVVEESQAVQLGETLHASGYSVRIYDPLATKSSQKELSCFAKCYENAADCIRGVDLIIVATAWSEFRDLEVELGQAVKSGSWLIDCWRLFPNLRSLDRCIPLGVGPKKGLISSSRKGETTQLVEARPS